MHISIEHFDGKYPSFNVSLASGEGKQPFITIKGCRIVDGGKGQFVSWPATRNEKTDKWWNHVYASDDFMAAVIAEARKTQPKPRTHSEMKRPPKDDLSDVPF